MHTTPKDFPALVVTQIKEGIWLKNNTTLLDCCYQYDSFREQKVTFNSLALIQSEC